MVSRTEEDEDQTTQTTSSQVMKRRLTARETRSHDQSNEEDKPRMFKRIIIRVLRANTPHHSSSENPTQEAPVFNLP